jgi:hypothetical protein
MDGAGLVRVRAASRYSLPVYTRLRSLKPCARHRKRSILREAPQGRSDKMWSESTFATEWSPGRAALAPSVAPPAGNVPLLGKEGAGRAIFFSQ